MYWKIPKHLPCWASYRKPAGQCWLESWKFGPWRGRETVAEMVLDILIHWKLPCVFIHSSPWVHLNWASAHSFISKGQEKRNIWVSNGNYVKLWITGRSQDSAVNIMTRLWGFKPLQEKQIFATLTCCILPCVVNIHIKCEFIISLNTASFIWNTFFLPGFLWLTIHFHHIWPFSTCTPGHMALLLPWLWM